MSAITYFVALPIAFSRAGDTSIGNFEPAEIIATFGAIPSDLADIMGLGA